MQTRSVIRGEPLDPSHELPADVEKNEDFVSSPEQGIAGEPGSRELEKMEQERDAYRERLVRLQAEFDNARRRTEREQRELKTVALADALRSLLPISDNFERAMKAPENNPKEFRSGMQLIRRQLEDAFHKLGLTPIPAKGEVFDPRVHEAVDVVDTTNADDARILEELQRGYKLGDQLVRPAMVRVAKNQHRQILNR